MTELISPLIPILYEDNHLLIVVKPPNMPTQADDSLDLDLLSTLKEDIKVRFQKPGSVYLGLVHRLDRPVGGIMVFAKTSKAASRLSDSVRNRTFDKRYLAIVHGKPQKEQGTLVHYLVKDPQTNMVTTVAKNQPSAKEAVLEYETIGYDQAVSHHGLSLLSVQLHTGRAHQIRVQFAAIGCPLYGDQRYGVKFNKSGQQIALWSTQLSFEHPTLKTQVSYSSLPPIHSYPWCLWTY